MALNKPALKNQLKDLFTELNSSEDPETALETYCEKLSTIIDDYVKSVKIIIPSSAIVVQGSSTTQTNGAQVIIEGTIS